MTRIPPIRPFLVATSLSCAIVLAQPSVAFSQNVPSIITQPRVEPLPRAQVPGSQSAQAPRAAAQTAVAPADLAGQTFRLTSVQIQGATALDSKALAQACADKIGTIITVAEAYAISDRIAAAYTAAGYALFRVNVPAQNFANGILRVQVIEGYVDAIEIQGDTEGADLSLLRGYAAHIVADRPLRQATLERYILLMNAIPGLTVGSDFQALPGAPTGVVQLRLSIARKRFQYGFGLQNQGQNILGQTQMGTNLIGNSLLRSGDRTQLTFATPIDVERFQYYALTHSTPLGTDGASVSFSLADLVTHPINHGSAGNAVIGSTVFSYPFIRAVHTSMIATLGGDALNSDSAIVGQTLSDERTRSVRVGLYYADDTFYDGVTSIGGTLAKGLDVMGARRANIAYGGPDYTKVTLRLDRTQDLPWLFSLRAKAFGQVSTGRLPPSEQFAFGGTDFGQALQSASITADRAIAVALELAHPFPDFFNTKWNTKTEYFVYGDWGRMWNAPTLYQLKVDNGATGGFGVRTKLLDKLSLQLAGATVLERPRTPGANRGWRLIVNTALDF